MKNALQSQTPKIRMPEISTIHPQKCQNLLHYHAIHFFGALQTATMDTTHSNSSLNAQKYRKEE